MNESSAAEKGLVAEKEDLQRRVEELEQGSDSMKELTAKYEEMEIQWTSAMKKNQRLNKTIETNQKKLNRFKDKNKTLKQQLDDLKKAAKGEGNAPRTEMPAAKGEGNA